MPARVRTLLPLLAAVALVAAAAPATAEQALARALAEQRQRAESAPSDPRVQNDLGNLLALAGETEAAEAAYRSAIASDPGFATAHDNLGRLLSRQGRLRAARRELKRALSIDPGNADARYHLGVVYAGWGLDRPALRAYARAFALDPSLADPQRNPHVLENRLALAAQLRAWDAERDTEPTRRHEEAESIASQARLVDVSFASTGVGPGRTGGALARAPGGSNASASPSAPIVLGVGDLRSGAAVDPAGFEGGERATGSSAARPRGVQVPKFRPGPTPPERGEPALRLVDPPLGGPER